MRLVGLATDESPTPQKPMANEQRRKHLGRTTYQLTVRTPGHFNARLRVKSLFPFRISDPCVSWMYTRAHQRGKERYVDYWRTQRGTWLQLSGSYSFSTSQDFETQIVRSKRNIEYRYRRWRRIVRAAIAPHARCAERGVLFGKMADRSSVLRWPSESESG
jgi:hypothetical protein